MSSGFQLPPPEVIAALAKENRSPTIIGIVIGATVLGLVCVLLRFFSRIKFVRLVGLEDYFIAVSMLFSICTSVCLVQGARYGNGKHLLNVPPQNAYFILKYLFFSIIAYHLTLLCTKLSILMQYRRIFTLKSSRIPIYIVMGLCVACGTTAVVTAIFTCVPVNAYWNMALKPFAKCVNQDAMYHANAALNITTDLLVAALPVRQIWTLQIAMRQKIALLLILTLGWFVVIISALRLYFLVLVAQHPMDQTWYSGPAAYWSVLEVNLAIVCASTPALKPLVIKVIPIFGSRFSRGSSKRSAEDSSRGIGFMKLHGKPSSTTMKDEILLEQGYAHGNGGVTALPSAYKGGMGPAAWKEIHVQRDFEQRSVNEERNSDDSRGGLFPKRMQRS